MKKQYIISVILLVFGIGMMLFVGLSGIGAPQPTSFINVEKASVLDETIPFAKITEDDIDTFPVLIHAMENGITHIKVYYPDVPEGGMTEREYYAISNLFETDVVFYIGPGYLEYEGDIYHIYIGAISGGSGFEESIANFMQFASKALIFAGAVLLSVNFVRSVAPAPRRIHIQNYIEEHPGCSEADVVKNTGYSRNSTVHHIQKLVSGNKIRETPYHKTVRYYPADESSAETDIINAARAKEKPAAILSALEKKPMKLSELEAETGISVSSLRWYLAKLEEDGIVLSEKRENTVYYSLQE
ncbi:MAG: ArsR family transcriptional regulator [Methanocorpusculum parvum]|nr:ArsR family transcriptional regulator [Methanocorpusculum parvum]